MNKNIYSKENTQKLQQANNFADGYKQFLSSCKTERECVDFAIDMAKKHNFYNIKDVAEQNIKLKANDGVYAVYGGKSVALFRIGSQKLVDGINIVGSHIDSPRLDLKSKPVFEDSGICFLDTQYYGGIKKYQWTTIPLAMHGVVAKKDGSTQKFVFGEDQNEPCVGISDLLPHLDREKINVEGESLDVIAGLYHLQAEEDKDKKEQKVKANVLQILKQKGIEEDDLFSAEIEVVPSGNARDFGLDGSMILGYGQDDRVCAYTSLIAFFEEQNPQKTSVCLFVDKEEIGSVGSSSASSKFFENSLCKVLNATGEYSEFNLRLCLENSCMLSSDVTAAFDPKYASKMNKQSDAFLAHGVCFSKFTGGHGKSGGNDANAEFVAKLRNLLDKNEVCYQCSEMGKVDVGGGSTIAYIMANSMVEVVDAGVPLLNMHAPYEISCKADVFEAYLCYKAFFAEMK